MHLFGAGETLFQTGWFIESITTQVLVVFAIRTRRSVFRSRPHVFLVAMALGVIAVAIALPLLPVGRWLGFVAPPTLFFAFLIGATLAYLAIVEVTKRVFFRVMAPTSSRLQTTAHTTVPNKAPTPAVIPMASAPQNVTRIAPGKISAPPARAASAPSSARKSSEVPDTE